MKKKKNSHKCRVEYSSARVKRFTPLEWQGKSRKKKEQIWKGLNSHEEGMLEIKYYSVRGGNPERQRVIAAIDREEL